MVHGGWSRIADFAFCKEIAHCWIHWLTDKSIDDPAVKQIQMQRQMQRQIQMQRQMQIQMQRKKSIHNIWSGGVGG